MLNKRYYFDTYWGTWNRVLQYPTWNATDQRRLSTIEFSMTPHMGVNATNNNWDDIASIRIRKHGTQFEPKDEFSDVLPMEWWNLMGEKIGEERRDFMAYHNTFLDEIDWVKYRTLNNGGASYFKILK